MRPELFRIPLPFSINLFGHQIHQVPIYGYGLMLVIGFLTAAYWARLLARRSGLDGELFINGALLALFTGIVGARLSHILENFADFTDPQRSAAENFRRMMDLSSGGLTYYGGFLLAFPTLVLYARWKKVPLRLGMDIVAPCLILALGFGRIGCFLNGCCYGARCDLPWAVSYPYGSGAYVDEAIEGRIAAPDQQLVLKPSSEGGWVPLSTEELARSADRSRLRAIAASHRSLRLHPAQLYSTFTCFLLAGLLYACFTMPHADGRVFALMLMLEGASRFMLELVRAEPPVVGRFSLSMIIGLVLIALGTALWSLFGRMAPRERLEPLGA